MISAQIPANEEERLKSLKDYHVLDSDTESQFDDLTALASSICQTPVSLVSLIDENRQWFKSRHGLDATETPREYAFCAHAILQDEIFEIEDSRVDERFADNPLVTDEPHVIFYAGAPLVTPDGQHIGTLCAIDHQPNKLSNDQRFQLQIIAKQVVSQLELRKNNRLKEEVVNELMELVENVNHKNEKLYHFSNQIVDDMGIPLRQLTVFSDLMVDDIENKDCEGLREKHHYIHEACEKLKCLTKDIFDVSQADLIHETAYSLDFKKIVDAVVCDAEKNNEHKVKIEVFIEDDVLFFSQEIRVKQILHQLISNSIKYANFEQSQPFVKISLHEGLDGICMSVEDNGLGIPESQQANLFDDFSRFHNDITHGSGLGMTVVKKHVETMSGEIEVNSSPQGTSILITLPNAEVSYH